MKRSAIALLSSVVLVSAACATLPRVRAVEAEPAPEIAAEATETETPEEPIPGVTVNVPRDFRFSRIDRHRAAWEGEGEAAGLELRLTDYRTAGDPGGRTAPLVGTGWRVVERFDTEDGNAALVVDLPPKGDAGRRLVRIYTRCRLVDLEITGFTAASEASANLFERMTRSVRVSDPPGCAPTATASASPPDERPPPERSRGERVTSTPRPTPPARARPAPTPTADPGTAETAPAEATAPVQETAPARERTAPARRVAAARKATGRVTDEESTAARREIKRLVETFVRSLRRGDRATVLGLFSPAAEIENEEFDALVALVRPPGGMNELRLSRGSGEGAALEADARVDWQADWRPSLAREVKTESIEATPEAVQALTLELSLRRENGDWKVRRARFSVPGR